MVGYSLIAYDRNADVIVYGDDTLDFCNQMAEDAEGEDPDEDPEEDPEEEPDEDPEQ